MAQRWSERLFDPREECVTIHGTVQYERRNEAIRPQACRKGRGFPMPMWNRGAAALASWGTTVKPRHLGVGSGLVDEDKVVWIEIELPVEPFLAGLVYIAASLFGGVRRLFLALR